jgi:hypothetical protein
LALKAQLAAKSCAIKARASFLDLRGEEAPDDAAFRRVATHRNANSDQENRDKGQDFTFVGSGHQDSGIFDRERKNSWLFLSKGLSMHATNLTNQIANSC